jgi:hypothetical protein
MIGLTFNIKRGQGAPLLSEKQFRFRSMLLWVYAILWLIILFSVVFVLSLPTWLRVSVIVVLGILAPAVTDLFESYQSYKVMWKRFYNKRGSATENRKD